MLLLESLDNAVKSDSLNPVLHLVLGNTYSQLASGRQLLRIRCILYTTEILSPLTYIP